MKFAWESFSWLSPLRSPRTQISDRITDQVFLRRFKGKCLPQLLDDPSTGRMLGDVNVQDAPPIMTDDEEAVEHTERNRWHCEEIHRGNRFPMVVKEGYPALGAVGIPRRSFHPTGDGSLGKVKAVHTQFPMDSRCAPGGVLSDHTEDQIPNLLRRRSPSNLPPNFGDQPPVHSKPSPVPANDGFGCDDEQGVLPIRPDSPGDYPEELIDEAEGRARMSTRQREELLAQSEILEKETSSPAKEADQHAEAEPDEGHHGQNL
jgi:hypothetical protein